MLAYAIFWGYAYFMHPHGWKGSVWSLLGFFWTCSALNFIFKVPTEDDDGDSKGSIFVKLYNRESIKIAFETEQKDLLIYEPSCKR